MKKYTQKELRNLVSLGVAEDISYADNKKRNEILKDEGFYTQIGYASGVYGCNGMLLQGNNTKKLYAITGRTQAIYIF